MIKCVKLMAILCIIMLHENVEVEPQEIPEAAVLAFAQMKDTFDNGAAASDKKEFEFFGAKIKNDMEVGFGDAVRSKRSNKDLRDTMAKSEKRAKRMANFSDLAEQIINSKEKFRTKRAADDDLFELSESDEYDYSSYSLYSSSESEEDERRKRSTGFEQFAEIFLV